MKKLFGLALLGLAVLGIGSLTSCNEPDKEYKMNILNIVVDNTGNHLAYCEPAKLLNLNHYVDIPELEDYSGYTTFIAKQGNEKSYFLVDNKKVNDGKYKFMKWE